MLYRPILRLTYRTARWLLGPALRSWRKMVQREETRRLARWPVLRPSRGIFLPRKRLSVLMTCENNGPTFCRTMKAICTQSRLPDEILIQDLRSAKGSGSFLEKYAADYPFIKLIHKKEGKVPNGSLTELARQARGDYLYFADLADYVLPGYFERAMGLAEEFTKAGVICGEIDYYSPEHSRVLSLERQGWETGYYSPQSYLHEYLEVTDPTSNLAPTAVFRREAFFEAGGWRAELGPYAASFVLHACALCYGLGYLDRPSAHYSPSHDSSANKGLAGALGPCDNCLQLMVSTPFARLFGDKFPKLWYAINCHRSAQRYIDAKFKQASSAEELVGSS